ncbi:MAG: hypothetical protein JSU00_28265 [Acidobacteria bacterium]|nr:hypothetical protein [Acidobacteriota bacterium]
MLPTLLTLLIAVTNHPTPSRPAAPLAEKVPCEVISAKDIQAWTGRAMNRTPILRGPRESTCDFTSPDAAITITARRAQAKIDLPAELGNLKAEFPDSKLSGVDGLGAAAVLVDLGEAGALLNVFRNDRDYLMIAVLGMGEYEKAKQTAIRIARTTLDRL